VRLWRQCHAMARQPFPLTDVAPNLARLPAYLFLEGMVAGRVVVDLGCGDGQGASRLQQVGARVLALAASAELAELKRAHPNLELPRCDRRSASMADASVDIVLCVDRLTLADEISQARLMGRSPGCCVRTGSSVPGWHPRNRRSAGGACPAVLRGR